MALLKSPVFIICCLLFVIHQALGILFNYHYGPMDSYLDALLAMPIILTLLLWERIYLFKWSDYFRLTILEVVLATLFVAFISEVIFPWLSKDFTSDWTDMLFYALGAALYYFTINPSRDDI